MNIQLPKYNSLPIDKFAAIFNKTTNSYKYFWLLAIMNNISEIENKKLHFSDLVFEIISLIWYPINFYQISFGKQDKLYEKVLLLRNVLDIPVNVSRNNLLNLIKFNKNNATIISIVNDIIRYVPYRFLTPWFEDKLLGLSDSQKNNSIILYSNNDLSAKTIYKIDITNKNIEITDDWFEYLINNMSIIKDFAYWNLLQYLEKRNPNIPNISQKLFEPISRNLKTAKDFWNNVLNETVDLRCIYSNEIIQPNNFVIDHYIPWSFVTHDQLWNLIPTSVNVNSKKSNKLPALKYLDKFAEVQYIATRVVLSKHPARNSFIDDYLLLFHKNIEEFRLLSLNDFKKTLKETISPLGQIASNSGFSTNWIYS